VAVASQAGVDIAIVQTILSVCQAIETLELAVSYLRPDVANPICLSLPADDTAANARIASDRP